MEVGQGEKRAGKEHAKEGIARGSQVTMVTIKGADQTRRDETPPLFYWRLCYTEATANRKIGSTLSASLPPFYPSSPLHFQLPAERKLFLKLKGHRKIYPLDDSPSDPFHPRNDCFILPFVHRNFATLFHHVVRKRETKLHDLPISLIEKINL